MTKFAKDNLLKIALVITMLVFATTCMVSGTLAALSAEYTWTSDTAKTGDFAYSDTNYQFALFGTNDIFPGDAGSGTLSNADFGSNTVSWEFSETNADTIPVVYYTLNSNSEPENLYSKYDFKTQYADKYVKLSGKYAACSSINTSPTSIAAGLSVDAVVYWAWPDVLYSDASGTVYPSSVYDGYNETLCESNGVVDDSMNTFLTTRNFGGGIQQQIEYVATSTVTGGYNLQQVENLVINNGKFNVSGTYYPVYAGGGFKSVNAAYELRSTDAYVFIIPDISNATVESFITDAETAGITVTTDSKKYSVSGDATEGFVATENESGNKAIIFVQPKKGAEKASVSVSITATVTKA